VGPTFRLRTVTPHSSLLVEEARALRPLIEQEAARAEAETTTTQSVVDALAAAGLGWILVPRELGGTEAGIEDALAVFEELAYADGSTGWSAMANATSSAFAAIYTSDDAAKTMFNADGLGIHAGMLGPVGTARIDNDGFVVTGRYQFGSGCGHATWFGAGTQEVDGAGERLNDESGLPALRVVFLRPEQVVVRGNWDVLGLAGTGSYDYTVDDQYVAEGFSFPLLTATPRRGGSAYNIGLFGIVASGHAGFALGVGTRALDELLDLVPTKQRMGGFTPVSDEQLFQHDFALHDAAMRSARAYVYDIFGASEAAALAGGAPSPVQQQRMRQATTYATRVAADAARFAYTWAGTSALRNGGVLQRCFRDIHAGTQHVYVDNNTLTAYTQTLLMSR
jgi:alkylation response protein AidB-like acyl-CoA dehydrogenase